MFRIVFLLGILSICGCDRQISSDTTVGVPAVTSSSESSNERGELIKTSYELRELMETQESTLVRAAHCSEVSLPDAVSAHAARYEQLLRIRGLTAGTDFTVTTAEIFDAIPSGVSVLFYHREESAVCAWLLDSTGPVAIGGTSFAPSTVSILVNTFYQASGINAEQLTRMPIRRGSKRPEPDARMVTVSTDEILQSISEVVFPGEIRDKIANYETLVVVPYGELGTLPYVALPTSENRILIDHSEVIVAPSLLDFYSAQEVQTGDPRWKLSSPGCARDTEPQSEFRKIETALIVGDPDYSFDTEYHMQQLPGALDEARVVAELFNVETVERGDATLDRVVTDAPQSDLLYFATHGISHKTAGTSSFIALTKGRLSGKDVQNMCLRETELAVLSACQTGLGQDLEGGTITLARAFQKAGVNTVVMSLWDVDDLATKKLMVAFSEHITRGEKPSSSLRLAMIETRKDYPTISHWASFSIFSAYVN